jgi:hypothetical protein
MIENLAIVRYSTADGAELARTMKRKEQVTGFGDFPRWYTPEGFRELPRRNASISSFKPLAVKVETPMGKETTVKHAPKSVFKKSNLASAVVVIVPENSHKTEDENENEDEEEAFN